MFKVNETLFFGPRAHCNGKPNFQLGLAKKEVAKCPNLRIRWSGKN
jgi:hypothetical protein